MTAPVLICLSPVEKTNRRPNQNILPICGLQISSLVLNQIGAGKRNPSQQHQRAFLGNDCGNLLLLGFL
jgi:hypothetical protein